MTDAGPAKAPFRFYTRLNLPELTGLRAASLAELAEHLRVVPGSSVYHHTHRFLQQHQHLSPEPPNDFAYWTTEVLGDAALGERLASIDIVQFDTIRSLREQIISTIEKHLRENAKAKDRFAEEGAEFHFIKSVSFVLATRHEANSLAEFAEILKRITIDSIYYHIFEARLRLERPTNDFSHWIDTSVGNSALARRIARLDPYTYTMEELRQVIIGLVEKAVR